MDDGDAAGGGRARPAEFQRRLMQDDLSSVGLVDAGRDVDERALAGAVLTDERVDLAAVQPEIRLVKRDDSVEGLADGLGFEDGRPLGIAVHCPASAPVHARHPNARRRPACRWAASPSRDASTAARISRPSAISTAVVLTLRTISASLMAERTTAATSAPKADASPPASAVPPMIGTAKETMSQSPPAAGVAVPMVPMYMTAATPASSPEMVWAVICARRDESPDSMVASRLPPKARISLPPGSQRSPAYIPAVTSRATTIRYGKNPDRP